MRNLTNFVVEKPTAVGTARTLVTGDQNGVFLLDTAAGSTATLPASIGDGGVYNFMVSLVATASHVVKVANTNDIIQGLVAISRADATGNTASFVAGATHDTITLNAGTSGGVTKGEWFEIVDLSPGVFVVKGQLTGTAATPQVTPFSATV